MQTFDGLRADNTRYFTFLSLNYSHAGRVISAERAEKVWCNTELTFHKSINRLFAILDDFQHKKA